MCYSPQITNNLPFHPHLVHLSKGLEIHIQSACLCGTIKRTSTALKILLWTPSCRLSSERSSSYLLPEVGGGSLPSLLFLQHRAQIEDFDQMLPETLAVLGKGLCGDENMKAAISAELPQAFASIWNAIYQPSTLEHSNTHLPLNRLTWNLINHQRSL